MKEIILKIVTKETIDFPMTREQMIKFPTHECRQLLYEEKIMIVQYKPAPPLNFDEEGFIDLVKWIYKTTLNAHSVEVVERD